MSAPVTAPLPRIAVIGASGFVGLRTTEILSTRTDLDVVPIVRAASSLAVLARQRLDWRIANFLSEIPLAAALRDCTVCVHAAIGDAGQIVRMAEVAYRACAAADVQRLVWLSSASVHGQNCPAGTDETSPLHDHHPLVYNNAKVRAERRLTRLAADRRVEVVMVRPGVVFGPRSRWITNTITDLRAGRAAWIDAGAGICNSIYIDNLVEAIRLASTVPAAAGETFLVGDAETVTWREFLVPIAQHFGRDEASFHAIQPPVIVAEPDSRLAAFTLTPAYARLVRIVPARAKRLINAVAGSWRQPPTPPNAWALRATQPAPRLTAELALLQQCRWRLPHTKAERILGYHPTVPFNDAVRRSLLWLDFAGLGPAPR